MIAMMGEKQQAGNFTYIYDKLKFPQQELKSV